MELLTINMAYGITLVVLILSTVLSRLELANIPSIYIDFVNPEINDKNKIKRWKYMHYLILFSSLFTGAFYFFEMTWLYRLSLVITTVFLLTSYRIRKTGKDGSDQMRILAYITLTLCLLINSETGKLIAICFLGLQALISYSTSGLAKVFSKHWRKGNVLADILGTYSYGIPKITSFLKKHPFLEKGMSYGAILTMLAVPVCFFFSSPEPILLALGCIFLFHFSTALLMGLNDFLFTFPLTYPGILVFHDLLFNY